MLVVEYEVPNPFHAWNERRRSLCFIAGRAGSQRLMGVETAAAAGDLGRLELEVSAAGRPGVGMGAGLYYGHRYIMSIPALNARDVQAFSVPFSGGLLDHEAFRLEGGCGVDGIVVIRNSGQSDLERFLTGRFPGPCPEGEGRDVPADPAARFYRDRLFDGQYGPWHTVWTGHEVPAGPLTEWRQFMLARVHRDRDPEVLYVSPLHRMREDRQVSLAGVAGERLVVDLQA